MADSGTVIPSPSGSDSGDYPSGAVNMPVGAGPGGEDGWFARPVDNKGLLVVGCPDGSVQPVRAVVHQRDRLLVVPDLHDADDRTEALLAHDAHLVVPRSVLAI